MPVEKQVMGIFAVTNGYLDTIAIANVRRWEREFYQFMDAQLPEIGRRIRTDKVLSKETEAQLRAAIERFSGDFSARAKSGSPGPQGAPAGASVAAGRSHMAKGRELKGRITFRREHAKIARTMEMVATSKMKRAQVRVAAARPYATALRDVIANLYSTELASRFRCSASRQRSSAPAYFCLHPIAGSRARSIRTSFGRPVS